MKPKKTEPWTRGVEWIKLLVRRYRSIAFEKMDEQSARLSSTTGCKLVIDVVFIKTEALREAGHWMLQIKAGPADENPVSIPLPRAIETRDRALKALALEFLR